jgi:hypothetical protein
MIVFLQLKRTRDELEKSNEENLQMKKMLSLITSEYQALHAQMTLVLQQRQQQEVEAAEQAASKAKPAIQTGPGEIVLLGQRASPQKSFPAASSNSGSQRSPSSTAPDSEISKAHLSKEKVKSESEKAMDVNGVSLELGKAPRQSSSGKRTYQPDTKEESSEKDSAMETHESGSHEETAVSEAQEQPQGWPWNKRMKSVLQDTSVRNARVSVRTRTDAPTVKIHETSPIF